MNINDISYKLLINMISLFILDELNGIFVKKINAQSVTDLDGRIQVNDQIIAVSNIAIPIFHY